MFAHAQKEAKSAVALARGILPRKCDSCHKKKMALQRSASGPAPDQRPTVRCDETGRREQI